MAKVEAEDIEAVISEEEAEVEVDQNIIMQQSNGDVHKTKLKELYIGANIMSNDVKYCKKFGHYEH